MEASPFDLVSNDLLQHVLSYCLAHTDVRLVCRRFYEVYGRYNLARLVSRELFADFVINYTCGTVEPIGFRTTPTTLCFYKAIQGSSDAYGLYHHLVEQNDSMAAWVSASNHLHVAILQPEFALADIFDLRPMLSKNKRKKDPMHISFGDSTLAVWNTSGFCASFLVDQKSRKLKFLACTILSSTSFVRLHVVGPPEHQVLAVASGKTLRVFDRSTLSEIQCPNLSNLKHSVLALPVGKEGDLIVASRGAVAAPGPNQASWGAHEIARTNIRGKVLWKVESVPNNEIRIPGFRSSGVCVRILKRCAIALSSSAVISATDGSELLGAIESTRGVNSRDGLHWIVDETFASAPQFVGRIIVRRALVKKGDIPRAECEFEPSIAFPHLVEFKFHICFPSAAFELAAIEQGMGGASKPQSISGLDFCCSENLLYMGVTHLDGKCAVRALCLATASIPKRTLWHVALPAELMGSPCACSSRKWRLRMHLAGERLALLVYPTEGNSVPRIVFLWKHNGEAASPVMLLNEQAQNKKCIVQ